MARSKGRRLMEDIELEYAAHPRKPGMIDHDAQRVSMLTHMPQPRVPSGPEPVRVPERVNGRVLESWERELYRQAMQRERRRELALFRGLIS